VSALGPIRVLVIDDSAFSRRTITRMLEASPLVRVIDWAHDGEEALRKTLEQEPDLVTLDLEMPRMDGFTFLRLLLARRPTPVLVISGRAHSQDVFKALDLGAVDFIAKPTPRAAPELESIQEELLRKVHALRQLRMDKLRERLASAPDLLPRRPASASPTARRVVAIGASTGGPAAVTQVLGAFTEAPPFAVVVSQHMPGGFTASFAERIDRFTAFSAREAREGDRLEPGRVLVSPGGCHIEFGTYDGEPRVRLAPRSPGDKYTPSVDRMFVSAAKHFGADLMAVVLTGMGDDGAQGVRAVKEAGGTVVTESEESAVVFGMPQQAIRTGAVDAVLPLARIAGAIDAGLAGAAAARRPGGRRRRTPERGDA
jgi:two-component system chemotaxis response regulator CheB